MVSIVQYFLPNNGAEILSLLKVRFAKIVFLTLAFVPISALYADDDIYDVPKISTLQKRFYPFVSNGATFELGFLPIDAFNKSLVVGLSYTYYLSEFTAWEIVNANFASNMPTDLRNDLQGIKPDLTGANRPYLDYINYFATTNLIYTPLYSKYLLFNASLLHGETSFLLGGGAAGFRYSGVHPLVSGGLILKFFLSRQTSLKFDFRELVHFDKTGANGILSIVLGFEFRFGKGLDNKKIQVSEDEIL